MSIKRVIQARSNLLLDCPFFGVLGLRLKLLEDNSQPTCWTDGQRLGFNPSFVESLTMAELQGVICHEVLHCANGHIWRRGNRDKEAWNYWCDSVVNWIVLDAGMRLPKDCVDEPHAKGKAVEMVYQEPKKGGKGGKDGKGKGGMGCGEVRDTPTPQEAAAEEQEWKQATLQAAQAAQARGKLPAGLERLVDAIKNPAIDWKAATRKFLEETARADFSWRIPNRRYIPMGIYMPSLRSETLPPVVVMGDSSGSMYDRATRERIASEVVPIVQEARPEITYWICGDTQFQCGAEYYPDDHVELKFKGGGGTDFRWAFEWIKEQGIQPACFIGITDLCGTFPDEPPDYPVLWAATTDLGVPWGEVLRIK